MTSKPDGGPAFPTVDFSGQFQDGMTRRQYIATQAMAALIAEPAHPEIGSWPLVNLIAAKAYEFADAMIYEDKK